VSGLGAGPGLGCVGEAGADWLTSDFCEGYLVTKCLSHMFGYQVFVMAIWFPSDCQGCLVNK
jgi:hypothetical protein